MISGIIGSKSCQLPKIASQVPGHVHSDSRTKQFSRWVQNETITFDLYSRSVPFVGPLLERLAAVRPLVLIMDGSLVARGCVTLMVSVIYAHRAIPIGWLVIEDAKGHSPTQTHLALVREVKTRVPETATVISRSVGDGEFDSPELQAELDGYHWHAQRVCRTAKNILIGVDDDWLSMADLAVTRAGHDFRKQVLFTQAAYSDHKSRGFQIDRSHLSDPERVYRLRMAASLAYLWVICLGTLAQADHWRPRVHRRHRCDLSLFQLGLRLLDYRLGHDQPLPSSFVLEPESVR